MIWSIRSADILDAHGDRTSTIRLLLIFSPDAAILYLHCMLSLAVQCIVIGPVCDSGVCNGRVGGVQTLLQPARAQCLCLSERFFRYIRVIIDVRKVWLKT